MKRNERDADNGPSDRDTRQEKLAKNASGEFTTLHRQKGEGAEAEAAAVAARLLEDLAVKLDDDVNGRGQILWNSPAVGASLKHLHRVIEKHSDKYQDDAADDDAPQRSVAIPTINLTEPAIRNKLAKGMITALQDPQWPSGTDDANTEPIVQVHGMRKDVGGSVAAHGRLLSPISLSLADGDGLLINARVAAVATDKAEGLRHGYVIQLTQFCRIHISQHCERYSTAGIGLLDFDILGVGPIPEGQSYVAADRYDVAGLHNRITDGNAGIGGNAEEEEYNPLEGWNYDYFPPPVPDIPCTRAHRTCSMYGTHFFAKCVCEEYPVAEKDLEELAKIYFAVTRPVAEMSNSEIRNMLYWCYATDVYHVRGWLNRLPLPDCLLLEIRMMYPNTKKEGEYKEFQESQSYF